MKLLNPKTIAFFAICFTGCSSMPASKTTNGFQHNWTPVNKTVPPAAKKLNDDFYNKLAMIEQNIKHGIQHSSPQMSHKNNTDLSVSAIKDGLKKLKKNSQISKNKFLRGKTYEDPKETQLVFNQFEKNQWDFSKHSGNKPESYNKTLQVFNRFEGV